MTPGLLHAHLARWAEAPPRLVLPDGTVREGADLLAGIGRATAWLAARGLGRGDRLVLQIPKVPALLEVHLAALGAGVSTVPLNPRATLHETRRVVGDARPALVVGPHPELAQLDAATLVAELAGAPRLPPSRVGTAEDEALLLFTSGTTGRPKGAPLRQRHVQACVATLAEAWRMVPADRLLHALPPFHVHGLIVAQHVALWAGATTIWRDPFEAADVAGAIARHQATVLMGVPTFHTRLLQVATRAQLASLRLVTSGSAPLPAEVHRAFEARFGHAILERYGMTEVGIVLANPYDGPRVPGAVGRELPGVRLRLVDPRGHDVPDGEAGELWVQGPSVFDGYLDRPDATADALVDGWMRTGDLGVRDAQGWVHLQGRRSELILVGGFNVYPREVEDALRELPGVRDAAVVGLPDPDLGERVGAAIVAEPGAVPTLDDLRTALGPVLSSYKLPRDLRLVTDLPRNPTGKLDKAALRAAFAPEGPHALPQGAWAPEVHAALCALLDHPPGDAPPQAVFDWDDTMLEGDCSLTTLKLLDARHGTRWHDTYFELLQAHGRAVAYPQITRWLAGSTPAELATLARELLSTGAFRFRPELETLVRAMQARGWGVWIVTASPQPVVAELARDLDLPSDHVLGMRLRLGDDGRYLDEIVPPATFCEGKAEAVRAFLPRLPVLVAGDSRSDVDMMLLAHHALLLDGHDVELRAEARARGWWIQPGWKHTAAEPGVRTQQP
ncbi:MAG: HAD-IB family phosphatase [Alphaproteobacteria bacterium]|nr:HAD-IB family phosphatase [Alphaproteobacteria bacterium]